MPIETPTVIQPQDSLPTGRVKINANFELFRVFVNALEAATGGVITPEDVVGLLVDGKIDPQYLEEYISSVTASEVSVVDSSENYDGTNVETVLAEIFQLIDDIEVSGGDGSKWYADSDAPASGLGAVGDFYLRITNGDFYEKTGASTWSLLGTLKGEGGAQGLTGEPGPTGVGLQGPAGVGVPSGGVTGQVLSKASLDDYDTVWIDQSGGGLVSNVDGGNASSIYTGIPAVDGGGA